MKTTVDIPTPLFKKAKTYAEQHHTTLKMLVELGLQRILLQHRRLAPDEFRLKKKSVPGNGLQPDLHWGDWGVIRKMAYEGRGDTPR